jgi:glucosamine 6-phosphate synthetase-like amidotransferase/phosphosugar isomerase protein
MKYFVVEMREVKMKEGVFIAYIKVAGDQAFNEAAHGVIASFQHRSRIMFVSTQGKVMLNLIVTAFQYTKNNLMSLTIEDRILSVS